VKKNQTAEQMRKYEQDLKSNKKNSHQNKANAN